MSQPRTSRSVWKLLTVRPRAGVSLPTALFAGSAGAQAKSLTVGSKNFSGAQVLSQAYGQALEAKGYDISFKDNIGPTEIVYPALKNGDLDAYADYQGTLLTYLGGEPTGDSARDVRGPAGQAQGHRHRREQAGARGRRERLLRHARPRPRSTSSRRCPTSPQVVQQAHVRRTARVRGRGRCASATRVQQLYGFKFKDVQKLDAGGPLTVQALEDGDIDVALLFTGSSVIPKDAVLLADDKGLQPADNPVLLMRKDKATPAALKIVNAVSAKLTTAGLQQDVARRQRGQGRPCRRGGRVPQVEQPHELRLDQYDSSRPATMLTVAPMITAPNTNDSSAWRSTVCRSSRFVMSVSDTWYVMPMVNAVYAKSR